MGRPTRGCPALHCPKPGDPSCQAFCGNNNIVKRNWPVRINDKSKIDVPNPKELVEKAIPNMDDLANVMLTTLVEMSLVALDADDDDVATSFSMPVFMLQDAAVQIREVKKIGAEEKKNKTKDLILGILSIVFAIIPFVGEAALAFGGVSAIARTALIIGEAGNAAISIVDIVNSPTSAPFAILGIIGSAAGIRAAGGSRRAFANAAGARRALSDDKLKLFSERFRHNDQLVQTILKKCR